MSPVVLTLLACSSSLDPNAGKDGAGGIARTGSGGSGGSSIDEGLGGGGYTGTGTGGIGGITSSGSAGRGGIGGAGGRGGTGGTSGLPVCRDADPMFTACVVSDADSLPLPDTSQDSVASSATVEAVGMGTAPAQCASARVFGAPGTAWWWLQARTTDNRLWTVGANGLGSAPPLNPGDKITFKLAYTRFISQSGQVTPSGQFQIADANAVPLLWAGANTYATDWITFVPGDPVCTIPMALGCVSTRGGAKATVGGQAAVLPPLGAATVGGYYVVIGQSTSSPSPPSGSSSGCALYDPPPFAAAAVKAQ